MLVWIADQFPKENDRNSSNHVQTVDEALNEQPVSDENVINVIAERQAGGAVYTFFVREL